jgi:hypothetical protein
VRADHDQVTGLGGWGVPTLVFGGTQALFGPVLIEPPSGEAAIRLWQLLTGWLEFPNLYEMQRPKRPADLRAIATAFQPYLEAGQPQPVHPGSQLVSPFGLRDVVHQQPHAGGRQHPGLFVRRQPDVQRHPHGTGLHAAEVDRDRPQPVADQQPDPAAAGHAEPGEHMRDAVRRRIHLSERQRLVPAGHRRPLRVPRRGAQDLPSAPRPSPSSRNRQHDPNPRYSRQSRGPLTPSRGAAGADAQFAASDERSRIGVRFIQAGVRARGGR